MKFFRKNETATVVSDSHSIYGYAYSDREINAINLARNARDGYGFYMNDQGHHSGILMKNDSPLRDDQGRMVIELPASASQQGSPIDLYLGPQIEYLRQAINSNPSIGVGYPVKILFPYKLNGWHWNVGEIVILEKPDGQFHIEGRKYDSYGSIDPLEDNMQRDIKEFFGETSSFDFGQSKIRITSVQTGVACGVYAALAMHNLKTGSYPNHNHIWSGLVDQQGRRALSERQLREQDYLFITQYNPLGLHNFCQPLDFSNTKKLVVAGKKPTTPDKTGEIQKLETCKKAIEAIDNQENLQNFLSRLEIASIQYKTEEPSDIRKFLNDLRGRVKGNPFANAVFEGGDGDLLIELDQIAEVTKFCQGILLKKLEAAGASKPSVDIVHEKSASDNIEELIGLVEAALHEIRNLVYQGSGTKASIDEVIDGWNQEISKYAQERFKDDSFKKDVLDSVGKYFQQCVNVILNEKKDLQQLAQELPGHKAPYDTTGHVKKILNLLQNNKTIDVNAEIEIVDGEKRINIAPLPFVLFLIQQESEPEQKTALILLANDLILQGADVNRETEADGAKITPLFFVLSVIDRTFDQQKKADLVSLASNLILQGADVEREISIKDDSTGITTRKKILELAEKVGDETLTNLIKHRSSLIVKPIISPPPSLITPPSSTQPISAKYIATLSVQTDSGQIDFARVKQSDEFPAGFASFTNAVIKNKVVAIAEKIVFNTFKTLSVKDGIEKDDVEIFVKIIQELTDKLVTNQDDHAGGRVGFKAWKNDGKIAEKLRERDPSITGEKIAVMIEKFSKISMQIQKESATYLGTIENRSYLGKDGEERKDLGARSFRVVRDLPRGYVIDDSKEI